MPKHILARGRRLWMRVKDEAGKWGYKPTPYNLGQESDASRYRKRAQLRIDTRRSAGDTTGPQTIRSYSRKWLAERQARGIATVRNEEGRIRNHVLPRIGSMRLDEVRPLTIRNLIRDLRKAGELAPRSIHHIYGVLHVMFRDAVVEELVETNPCILKSGELPSKVDKDSEWRALAMYSTREIERLISDTAIPVERRVLNALKALAGLRHGEAAGLRWRHWDATLTPLGRLLIATSYDTGRTKTEVTRRVPVHPVLARILAAWRVEHWERVYGRAPQPGDLIVPTRAMNPIAVSDAARYYKEDLRTLGLRVEAGKFRARGGHDLRAWFITTAQEHGAHRDLLRVVTHTAKGDIVSGYTRATWPALCAEVAKLQVQILDGKLLELATGFATAEKRARNRWKKVVGVEGIEPPTYSV
jgi:integrase